MSTRSSVGVISEGKYKATYCHFDEYPCGVGCDMVDFIQVVNKKNDWEKFKEMVNKVVGVSSQKTPTKKQQEKYSKLGFSNTGVSRGTLEEWYCLLREVQGADTFLEIYKGKLKHIILGNDFIKDSLFCEYAYIINLDTMKFEIYFGFQEEPQIGNRFGEVSNKGGYYPCKLAVEFTLRKIPKNWLDKVQKLENPEYEE